MRYFKAYETDERPYLLFNLIADSDQELDELELSEADLELVVTEDQLMNEADPNYISFESGICHKRIFGGEIVDRLSAEITEQEEKLSKSLEVVKTKEVNDTMAKSTFSYAGKEFPLTPAARVVYQAVIDREPASILLVTTTGNYNLLQANIETWKEEYYNAVFAANATVTSI